MTTMKKTDVNGKNAHPIYVYLKSKAPTEEYKGIKIACEGTKPAIRLAMFDLAGEHFTVSFRSDKEDQGLTIEEVETLMEELFPEDLMK